MEKSSRRENSVQSKAVANISGKKEETQDATFQFVDNRPEAIAQRKRQEMANKSPQVQKAGQWQAMANQKAPIQKKENNTGLPDTLKSGVENLSGISMDDVKVYRNSDKPAHLQAHAYAQGTDIHLGPGQEKHLPHEAWHVVQQKQGRVKPTVQMQGSPSTQPRTGVNVNDDTGLEKEADVMGAKAFGFDQRGEKKQASWTKIEEPILRKKNIHENPVQLAYNFQGTNDEAYVQELYDEANEWAINFPDFEGSDFASLTLYLELLELVKALDFTLEKGEVSEQEEVRALGIRVTDMEIKLSALRNRPTEAEKVVAPPEPGPEPEPEPVVKTGWGGGSLAKIMAPMSPEQLSAQKAKAKQTELEAKVAAFNNEVEALIRKIDTYVEKEAGTPDGSGVKSGQQHRVNYFPKFKATRQVITEAANRWPGRTKPEHTDVKNHCMSGHMGEKEPYTNFLRQVSQHDTRRANVHVYVKK